MARTPSNMIPLGSQAPDFTLPNTITGSEASLQELKSDKATVIMFICNHCPFVIHLHTGLVKFIEEYTAKGVAVIAISANDIENYPQDAPDKMKALWSQLGLTTPYLYDASQDVAKAYDAACTPDFYVYDKDLKLAYRGQFDGSRPQSEIPVTGEDLRGAVDALLNGTPVTDNQLPSLGCNIKWKE